MPRQITSVLPKDSKVRCDTCGRVEHVNFGRSLTHGWPKCCQGYTMTLITRPQNLETAVSRALQD